MIPSRLNCGLTAWQSFIGFLLFLDEDEGVVWYMKWIFGGVPFWGNSQIMHVAKCHFFQNFFRCFLLQFWKCFNRWRTLRGNAQCFFALVLWLRNFLGISLRPLFTECVQHANYDDNNFRYNIFVFAFWPWLPPNRPTLTYWLIKKKKNVFWPAFLEVGISHLAHEWIFVCDFSVPHTLLWRREFSFGLRITARECFQEREWEEICLPKNRWLLNEILKKAKM